MSLTLQDIDDFEKNYESQPDETKSTGGKFYPDWVKDDLSKQVYDMEKQAIEEKYEGERQALKDKVQAERDSNTGFGQNLKDMAYGHASTLERGIFNTLNSVGLYSDEKLDKLYEKQKMLDQFDPGLNPDSGYTTAGNVTGALHMAIPAAIALRQYAIPVLSRALPSVGSRLMAAPGSSSALTGNLSGTGSTLAAMGEGAFLGNALSDNEDRTGDVVGSSLLSGGIDTGLRLGSRGFIRGLGQADEMVTALKNTVGKVNNKPAFVPILQSTDPVSKSASQPRVGTAVTRKIMDIAAQFPGAQSIMKRQSQDFGKDVNESLLRRYFPGKDKANTAVNALDAPRGNFAKAIDASRGTLKSGLNTPLTANQRILAQSASKARGGNPTGQQMANESRSILGGQNVARPSGFQASPTGALTDLADDLAVIQSRQIGPADLATRSWFAKIPIASSIAGVGARVIATKGFQNFLLGSTRLQQMVQQALRSGDKNQLNRVMNGIIAEYSASFNTED
tara:strand:+ start:13432 stop:14955 length:1524 start_codon:yes stop_codon:yes gene_type:complete